MNSMRQIKNNLFASASRMRTGCGLPSAGSREAARTSGYSRRLLRSASAPPEPLLIRSPLFSNVMCFIFVLFFLFGTKIAYLDLSIIVPPFFFLLVSRDLFKANKHVLLVAFLIVILMLYQTTLQLAFQTFDLDSLLRLFRAAIVCILGAVIVGSLPFSSSQLLMSIFYSLLFQAVLIDVAACIEPLNNLLSFLSGNDRVMPFRASGLLAGFDIAGLFCVIGSLMLTLRIYRPKYDLMLLIFFTIFGLGSFFTSRVSMVLFVLVFISANFLMLLNYKVNFFYKLFIFTVLSLLIIWITLKYMVPIITTTFSLGVVDVDDDLLLEIVSRFSTQPNDHFLWSDMFFLPDSVFGFVFGVGTDAPTSDVGYIKDIFRYGLVGVVYSFAIYFYIYGLACGKLKLYRINYYLSFLTVIFTLAFLLTLKNNYFYTRGIFPFIVLIICVPLIHVREMSRDLPSISGYTRQP